MITTTTLTNICNRVSDKILCKFEMSRRPRTAHAIENKYYVKTTFEIDVPDLKKYEDTACARLEAERRPRAVARMKKLKNKNLKE